MAFSTSGGRLRRPDWNEKSYRAIHMEPARAGACSACSAANVIKRCTNLEVNMPNIEIAPPSGTRFFSMREFTAVQRIAHRQVARWDIYHHLRGMGWLPFFALLAVAYLLINLIFGLIFLAQSGSIANVRPGAVADAFFFSTAIFAGSCSGNMHTATFYGNVVQTSEVMLRIGFIPITIALIIARFSRPVSGVVFSKVAVVGPHEGTPKLMLRVVSQRSNVMLNAQANVMLTRVERTAEGSTMVRFYDLKLERNYSTCWLLTWTLMHAIDEKSPLWGLTRDDLISQEAQIVLAVGGIDETLAQPVNAYHCYEAKDIVWDRCFSDIFARSPEGQFSIDFGRLSETLPLAERA